MQSASTTRKRSLPVAYIRAQMWIAENPWLTDLISERVETLDREASLALEIEPNPPTILYDCVGTTAGRASSLNLISLNAVLLVENRLEFVERTVTHELAHCIVYRLKRGAAPHGAEWKQVMRLLGAEPAVRHDYDVSQAKARAVATYRYECGCGQQHELGVARHRKAASGAATYRCLECGRRLMPVRR